MMVGILLAKLVKNENPLFTLPPRKQVLYYGGETITGYPLEIKRRIRNDPKAEL